MTRHPKELLAWIALVSAVILLGVSLAIAQEPQSQRSRKDKNSVSIKITKKENGITTRIDTSLSTTDPEAIELLLEQLEEKYNISMKIPTPPDAPLAKKESRRKKEIVMHFDGATLGEKEQDEIEKEVENSMREAKAELEKVCKEMHNIHIEVNSSDTNNFTFDFEMPELPEIPVPPDFPSTMDFSFHAGKDHHIKHHSGSIEDQFDGIDSVDDEDHLIFFGDEGEDAPVFEKEIIGKNGQKAFVFKRSQPAEINNSEKESGFEKESLRHLRYYPNPNHGKFDLDFYLNTEGDTDVSIFDPNGKEVFHETLKKFSGEYSNQIDISDKGKGNYLLKIAQGNKSISKKIIVE
ncbi:MAG: T9SS type A sorting domain-containing protein [Bacteroidetes bacterium]|nr:T9SS type A sorting domain-containing protein [Bacteroidota bacterium]